MAADWPVSAQEAAARLFAQALPVPQRQNNPNQTSKQVQQNVGNNQSDYSQQSITVQTNNNQNKMNPNQQQKQVHQQVFVSPQISTGNSTIIQTNINENRNQSSQIQQNQPEISSWSQLHNEIQHPNPFWNVSNQFQLENSYWNQPSHLQNQTQCENQYWNPLLQTNNNTEQSNQLPQPFWLEVQENSIQSNLFDPVLPMSPQTDWSDDPQSPVSTEHPCTHPWSQSKKISQNYNNPWNDWIPCFNTSTVNNEAEQILFGPESPTDEVRLFVMRSLTFVSAFLQSRLLVLMHGYILFHTNFH